MQDVYASCQADRVDGAIRIANVVFDDLQDSRATKSPQRLGIGVFSPALRDVECIANRILFMIFPSAGLQYL